MDILSLLLRSSVGRKWLNGLTGVLLLAFIVEHVTGNILLLFGPEAYNRYVARILGLGEIVYVAEVVLGLLFLFHAVAGVSVWLDKRRARPTGYALRRSAGPPSRQTLSSRSMIVTGVLMLAFIVWHLVTFRFGPHYTVTLDGRETRDLYALVVETFARPAYVISYEVVMILLGLHLRHGFWSAFQTLGVSNPRYTRPIHAIGIVFAVVVALGFLAIPPVLYFTGGVR